MQVGMLQQGTTRKEPQIALLAVGTHTTATATTLPRRPQILLPAPTARSATWHCRTAAPQHRTFKATEEEDALSVRINKGEGTVHM